MSPQFSPLSMLPRLMVGYHRDGQVLKTCSGIRPLNNAGANKSRVVPPTGDD
ncbi:hypothetical protein CDEST_07412 [Colletotrichum destructivum]|uniref:Uncharacterized protein n=1 Tax=Colletotrichum destructivum TaxID=34406 RepID=A0AAX4IFZ9_9PEZI|nr:hypothetical protein CDEST_07412 [Colletotrichum destructivum]